MAETVKLRRITTPKASLTPEELEALDHNFWVIEHGLNSVGAVTPVPGGTSSPSVLSLDHGALNGLTDDDHLHYLLLAGRGSAQNVLGPLILNSTISGSTLLAIRPGSTSTALELRAPSSGTNPILKVLNNTGVTEFLRITSAGRLGINVTSPGGLLGVNPPAGLTVPAIITSFTDTNSEAGTLGIWQLKPNLRDSDNGVPGSSAFQIILDVDNAIGQMIGLDLTIDINEDAILGGGIASALGLKFTARSSGSTNIDRIAGVQGLAQHLASGTLNNLVGLVATVTQGGGLCTDGVGLDIGASISSGKTLTNWRGIWSRNPIGPGTLTNAYGVYIDSITKGSTLNYAIYAAGGQSVHGGSLTLGGVSAPNAILELLGAGTARAATRIAAGAAPTTPGTGDIWHDSTMKRGIAYWNGIKESLPGVLFTSTADVLVISTSTETTLIGTGIGSVTLPANYLLVGKTIRLKARGHYTSQGAAPDPFIIRFKLGSTTIIATATCTPVANAASWGWELEVVMTCRTTGASGTVIAQGSLRQATASLLIDYLAAYMVNTSVVTIDTTASQVVDLTIDYTTGTAQDSITCTNLTLESLN